MDKKTRAGSRIAEIAGKMVTLLEPLESQERQKVINASLTILGEAPSEALGSRASGDARQTTDGDDKSGQGLSGLPAKANNWARQNGLSTAQLEQVFDITGADMTVIASEVPGKSKKEKTHNAFVLQGISRLLASGDPAFDDKAARKLCEDLGCYDAANHSTYMSDKGNLLTGSKKLGWKLTAPGLKHGADLVMQLTKKE